MSEEDFYAPPAAQVYDQSTADGVSIAPNGDIITRSPLLIPLDVCAKCGQTPTEPKVYDRKLYYTPPWVYLLLLLNVLIFIIGALVARKQLQAQFAVCSPCRSQRLKRILGAIGAAIAAFVLLIVSIANDIGTLMVVSLLAFLGALVATLIVARPVVHPHKHKDGVFDVKAPRELADALKSRAHGSATDGTW